MPTRQSVDYAVNVAWNSTGWCGLPKPGEGGNFEFVARGGIPAESWNFDFASRRNTKTVVYGYAPRIERARRDAGNIVLVSRAPEGEHFVVGLYHSATILKGKRRPWRAKYPPASSGRNAYVNLAVPRSSAASCADPRLLRWNPDRYYHRLYGNRQWPGRQTFLLLPTTGVRRLLAGLVAAHERWARSQPGGRSVARHIQRVARIWSGGGPPRAATFPPETRALPTAIEVVKAERRKVAAERLLRNAPQLRALKDAYGYQCQIDPRHRIALPDPPPYIEVHHLQPIAQGGVLVDPAFSNCLVVCPSCHILLQNGALWIDPADGRTVRHFAHDRRYEGRKLKLLRGHRLSAAVLRRLVPVERT